MVEHIIEQLNIMELETELGGKTKRKDIFI